MHTIMLTMNDKVGGLKQVLTVFEEHNVSMTHIQSKPQLAKCVAKLQLCGGALPTLLYPTTALPSLTSTCPLGVKCPGPQWRP